MKKPDIITVVVLHAGDTVALKWGAATGGIAVKAVDVFDAGNGLRTLTVEDTDGDVTDVSLGANDTVAISRMADK